MKKLIIALMLVASSSAGAQGVNYNRCANVILPDVFSFGHLVVDCGFEKGTPETAAVADRWFKRTGYTKESVNECILLVDMTPPGQRIATRAIIDSIKREALFEELKRKGEFSSLCRSL